MDAEAIIKQLKKRREQLNMSQEDVASKIDSKRQYIHGIEKSKNIGLKKLIQIAGVLNLTVTLSENITYKPD